MTYTEKYNKLQTKMNNIFNKLCSRDERKLLEDVEKYSNVNFDALVLNTLRNKFGFTNEQLKEYFEAVSEYAVDVQLYSVQLQYMPDMTELSEAGVNLLAWEKEVGNI